MEKLSLEKIIKGSLELGDITLLGVGPMSTNVIYSCMEIGRDYHAPMMFIASRNQIDLQELGGGYVNGWDQNNLVNNLHTIADDVGYSDYYVCRDHGGPWQRDEERNSHLPVEKAMELAKKSFSSDIEAGFDMIMVDPTKDPFSPGKVVPLDFVLEKTVELIKFCEEKRLELNRPPICYEVGTEETNGGLTTAEEYDNFLHLLKQRLEDLGLPMPAFAVGQTGTLVKSTIQAGSFNPNIATKLASVTKKYGVCLKEHNADYLDEASLLMHIPSHVGSINVAPQFGTEETRAYLILDKIEREFEKNHGYKLSQLSDILLDSSIKTGRWKKWVKPEQTNLSYDDIRNNQALSKEILEISGHYTFNEPQVKDSIEILNKNLKVLNIDGERFVREHIKKSVKTYTDCLNLTSSLDRIKALL